MIDQEGLGVDWMFMWFGSSIILLRYALASPLASRSFFLAAKERPYEAPRVTVGYPPTVVGDPPTGVSYLSTAVGYRPSMSRCLVTYFLSRGAPWVDTTWKVLPC